MAAWNDYSLIFNSGAATFTIVGNAFDVLSKIENNSTATQTISVAALSAGNAVKELNPVSGNLVINSADLFTGGSSGEWRVWGDNGNTLSINGVISDGGALSIQRNTTVIFQRTNTYTGQTWIHAGQIIISNGARAGTGNINLGGTNTAGSSATNALYLGTSSSSGGATNTNAININASGGASSLGGNNTSGVNAFSGSITLNQGVTFRQASGGTLIASGVISGANAVTNAGSGTLVLSGNNTFSGAMAINAGVVRISHANALGTTAAGTTVASGAALELSDNITTAAESLALSGTGISSGGALRNVSGNNTYAGTITNTAAARINSDSGTLTLSGAINGTNQALTLGGAGIVLVTGNVTNSSAGVTKDGAGTVSLRGTNTYTGTTTVNAGVLEVTNRAAIADTAAVSLSNNAGAVFLVSTNETIGSLQGGGASGGNVSIVSGSTLTVSESGSQTFSGLITNSGALVKSGTGTMILAAANTFTGGATLSAGVLRAGNNSALGTGTFALNGGTFASGDSTARSITNVITVGGNVQFGDSTGTGNLTLSNVSLGQATRTFTVSNNTTIAGVISNGGATAGALTKAGTGTLTLSGVNNYTGATTISAGELALGAAGVLSDSTAVTVNGGTLNLGANNETVSTFTISSGTLGGSATLTAGSYGLQGGNVNAVLGSGAITVSAGTTALGSAGRLNTGSSLTINSGQLTLGGAETVSSLAGIGGTLAMGANTFSSGGGNASTSYSGVITGAGGLTKTGTGTLTLSGNSTGFTGTTTISGGAISVAAAGNLGANPGSAVTNQLTLNGGKLDVTTGFTANANAGITVGVSGGTIDVSTNQRLIQGGGLHGTGAFTKAGAGTLSLTNTAGAYAGSLTVTNGTLQANTSLRGANISVGNSGTLNGSVLMGSGSVGTVTINTNGQISPGNSVGILSISNTLNLNGGGSYLWEITNATAGGAGTNWDLISVDTTAVNNGLGTANIGGSGTFTVNGLAIDGFSFDGSQSYTNNYFQIVRASAVTGSTANLAFVSTNLGSGAWSFATNTGGIFLNYQAAGATNLFTNSIAADQGAANISGDNALGAFATITNAGGPTVVVISNSAALTFTNANNSYSGITLVEQGTLVTTANSANAANGAFGNASTAVQVGSTNTGNANAANLLIGGAGVDVGRAIAVNTGGTGVRTIGATNSSGTATYSGAISMGTNVILSASNASGTTLFSGTVSGSGTATVAGAGTVIFTGANDYTGATVISNGATLRIGNNTALGTTAAGTTVQSGGTLALSNSITEDEAITLSGLGVGSAGAIRSINGNNTISGNLTLGALSRINSDAGLLTLSGGIDGANFGLTVGGLGNTTISGAITNSSGLLTKDGSGTLTLSGGNNYSGGTLVSAGALQGDTTSLQGTITNNGSVIFDQSTDGTYSSVLSGTGTLIKTNAGVLTLSGANAQGGTLIGGGTLSIGSGGTTGSLTGPITNNATLLFNRSDNLTQASVISGSGALNKAGAGTLTLSQANTYTGATTISNGAIRVSDASALGTAAAGTTVVSGAALELTGGITVASEALTISGTGISSGGALRNISGDNTYGGAVTLGAASLITSDAGLLTVSGDINGANNNLTFLGAGNIAVSGAITNSSGALIKGGASTLTLSGNNTYTGATTISNGSTIIAASGNALGATNGATTVNDGGVLALSNATGFSSAENITIGNTTGGALRNLAGANTNTGTISLSTTTGLIAADTGSTLRLGNINNGAVGNALTFSNATNSTILLTGNLTNMDTTSTFFKTGTGSLVISNAGATVGGAQLQLGEGTVTLAAGSYSTNAASNPRGLDLGLDAGGNATALDTAFYVNSGVTMSNTTFVAAGSGQRIMGTESTNGTATINGEIFLGSASTTLNLSAAGGGTAAFTGNLINTGNITKIGAGTVILSGTNTAVGTVTVGSGTLAITNGNAIANGNSVVISNVAGAALVVNQTETIAGLSGGGTTGGTVTLNAQLNSRFDSASNNFAGTITGSGILLKGGTGTLTLSGSNSFTGGVTNEAGTILIGNNAALGAGTFTVDFNNNTNKTIAALGADNFTLSQSNNIFNDLTIGQATGNIGKLTFAGGTFLGGEAGTRTLTIVGTHEFSGGMTGLRGIVKDGAGTLMLSGANTFTGGIFIDQGAVDLAGGSLAASGIDIGGGSDNTAITASNAILRVSTNGTFTQGITVNSNAIGGVSGTRTIEFANTNGTATLSGALSQEKAFTVNVTNSGAIGILGGVLSTSAGSGGPTITVAGNGTLGVTNTANTTDARWSISSGATLAIGNSRNLGADPGGYYSDKVTLNGGTLSATNNFSLNSNIGIVVASNSTISVGSGLVMTNPAAMTGSGNLTKAGSGTLLLSGNNVTNTGRLIISAGTVSVGAATNIASNNVTNQITLNGGTLETTAGMTLGNRGIMVDSGNGTIDVTTGGLTNTAGLYGTGNLTKTGLGTMTLSGTAGAYAGNITVTNGTLQANTTLRGANISVGNASTANGSVLMGSGSVGTVTINTNGQISPGNSVGTLTVSNSLTFNGGGSYLWEITNTTAATPGVGWDLISVDTGSVGGGTLTIGSEGQFTVLGTAFGGFGFDTTANYTNDYFMIVRGNVSGSLTNLAFSSSGLGNAGNWSFSIGAGGTNLYLNYTAPFSGFVFTNGVVANQGDANLVTNNAAGAFAIIADQGGATSVTISNSAPLTFTNGANSYTGGTAIEQGVLVTTVDAGNGGGAFGTNAGNISLGSTNTGNTNAATLLIGADGVTVSKGVDVNAGGTGIRTIGATNSSGVATYSGNVIMNTNVTLSASNSSGTTLFTGVLSQSGAVTVAGAGTVTLAGANTFTNNVGIASGATLVASNNSALGGGSGTTTVSNGATLALAGNINEDEAVTIAGTGVGGNGALRNISGANTNTGAITLSANATIKAESGTRLSLSNVDITGAANRSVTFDGAGTNLVTGSISTAGGSLTNRIVKSGSGELVISNNGTTGTGQLRLGEGTVVLAAGSLTTSQDTGTRAIDIGLSGDAVGTSTAANATLLARSGVTVSNSIYVAPSGGDGSFTRTIGTDSTSGTVTYNNQMYLANTAPLQITSAGTANVVYSGNISNNIASESATITKVGAGSLTLSASNDWRGGFIAGAGTTILSGGNAIYDTNTVVVSNNATLLLSSSETIGSLAGAGTVTLGANSLVTGSNSASTTYSGVIGGTGGIFKAGTGTFTLAGANTYSGDTIVNAGTLAFSNGSVNSSLIRLGPDGSAGDATVLLSDSDGGTTVNSTFVVRPGGGNRSLVSSNSSGINTYAGSVYLDGGATISQQAAGVFALTGTEIDVKSQTLTLSSVTNGNVAVSSTIFDSNADVGNLVKSGNGTVTLTGANAYAGSTLISAGTLQVGDGGGSGQLGAGNVTNNASLLINRTGAITMGNTISGTGSVTLIGGGVLNITGTNNSYTGNTIISNGTVRISTLANSNTVSSIGVSNNVTLAGTDATNAVLDYTGGNVTTDRSFVVNEGGGTINMASSSTEMTLTGSASGSGKLIVGEGTLVLSNSGDSFAPGSIQVDSGATLVLAADDQIGNTTGLILNGGTFLVDVTNVSETMGSLTLTGSANSIIDFGNFGSSGTRSLTFASFNAISWTGSLTITNWQGSAWTPENTHLYFTDSSGFTQSQLANQIVFADIVTGGGIIGGGELVPVPEPRVYAAAIALLAAVGWRERKRLLGLIRRKRS